MVRFFMRESEKIYVVLVTPSLKSAAASLGGGMAAAAAAVFGGLQTECDEKSFSR